MGLQCKHFCNHIPAERKNGLTLGKSLFALSGAAMTLLLSQGGSLLFIGAGVLLSLAVCVILAFRFNLPDLVLSSLKPLSFVISAILTVFVSVAYHAVFARTTNDTITPFLASSPLSSLADTASVALPVIVCIFASFALFVWFHLFFDRAINFVQRWLASSCRLERLYLLVGFIFVSVAIVLVYSRTTAFFGGAPYDVVYTADSGNLITTNSFFYVNAYENDIRQPLFAVFSMPFAALAMLASKLLFFVPNAYPMMLACVQAGLLLFSFTLIARILELSGMDRVLFLLLAAISYPSLLFFFTAEQYIFAVFWVILLLYAWHEKAETRTIFFVAATGSLLTSGAFFPLLFAKKDIHLNLRALVGAGLAFLAVFIVFGRVPLLNRVVQTARDLASFAGKDVDFLARATQFFAFVAACFVRPVAGVDLVAYTHPSYQMHNAGNVNWIGLALFALVSISAVLHRKDSRMHAFSLWVGFSVVLLLFVGWGAAENGMVLYTLYFSWAYSALVYTLLRRIVSKNKILRCGIASAFILLLAFVNVLGLIDLFRFAIDCYPVM